MKFKSTALLLAVAMLLGLAVLPAAANSGGNQAGVFRGVAFVDKTGTCTNDGTVAGATQGGGLGLLPRPDDYKQAVFSIVAPAGSVIDVPHLLGDLTLCGNLTGPLDEIQSPVDPVDNDGEIEQKAIGASCIATKGYGGQGVANFTNHTVYLENLGWKATLGGSFVVTADTATGMKDKESDLLVAVVQALSEGAVLGCIEKERQVLQDPGKSGRQPFDVVAAYAIIAGQDSPFDKDNKKDQQ